MKTPLAFLVLLAPLGCGGSGKHATGYSIQSPPTSAQAGDTVLLQVSQTFSDGTLGALPAGATLTWTGVPTITILAPGSTADSPIPASGAAPTAFFVLNPSRPDHATDLENRLFVRDAGTSGGSITVTGTIAGDEPGTVTATIAVTAAPVGNATNGATLYGNSCAVCHGKTGHGTDANADGSYTIAMMNYDFPALGINAEDGNAGSDDAFNAAVFAQAARGDFDDDGVALREPMVNWLAASDDVTGKKLSTQDLADIYAFMQTQTH